MPVLLTLVGTLFFSVVVVGILVNWSSGSEHPGLLTVKIQKLASGELPVQAGRIRSITFAVTSTMFDARVVGRFGVAGGAGNDIQVFLTDEDNFSKWKNGHPAHALYSSGKRSAGSIDLPIKAAGTYYLVFSNTFSVSGKQVNADVDLRYQVKSWFGVP